MLSARAAVTKPSTTKKPAGVSRRAELSAFSPLQAILLRTLLLHPVQRFRARNETLRSSQQQPRLANLEIAVALCLQVADSSNTRGYPRNKRLYFRLLGVELEALESHLAKVSLQT